VCDTLPDGKRALRIDYSLDCDDPSRAPYYSWAVFMAFVYPLGTPAVYCFLLHRERAALKRLFQLQKLGEIKHSHEKLKEEGIASSFLFKDEGRKSYRKSRAKSKVHKKLGDDERHKVRLSPFVEKLTDGYTKYMFWWEVVECARKIGQVGLPVFFEEGSTQQLIVGLVICFLSAMVYATWQPHEDPADHLLQKVCQFEIFIALLSALVLRNDARNPAVDLILTVMLLAVPMVAFLQQLRQFSAWLRPRLRGAALRIWCWRSPASAQSTAASTTKADNAEPALAAEFSKQKHSVRFANSGGSSNAAAGLKDVAQVIADPGSHEPECEQSFHFSKFEHSFHFSSAVPGAADQAAADPASCSKSAWKKKHKESIFQEAEISGLAHKSAVMDRPERACIRVKKTAASAGRAESDVHEAGIWPSIADSPGGEQASAIPAASRLPAPSMGIKRASTMPRLPSSDGSSSSAAAGSDAAAEAKILQSFHFSKANASLFEDEHSDSGSTSASHPSWKGGRRETFFQEAEASSLAHNIKLIDRPGRQQRGKKLSLGTAPQRHSSCGSSSEPSRSEAGALNFISDALPAANRLPPPGACGLVRQRQHASELHIAQPAGTSETRRASRASVCREVRRGSAHVSSSQHELDLTEQV